MTKKAYCFGHISTGKLYRIKGAYPQANGYAEYTEILDNYCGEALSTGIVLQRLGVHTILEGNWIGDNEDGRKTLEFIKNTGISCDTVRIQPGYSGVHEVVISDATSRTVFGRYCDLLFTTPQWDMPTTEAIRQADIITADPSFGAASELVVTQAAAYGKPFIAIDTPYTSILTRHAAVCIISEDFLRNTYQNDDWNAIFEQYCLHSKGLTIFTFGEKPLWYGTQHRELFSIEPVAHVIDTAGAGDSFRAGIMYGMVQGMNTIDMIAYACKVAAQVIQSSPGVLHFNAKSLL